MAPAKPLEPSPDPWVIARDRYFDSLEPHEKTLFREATLENLYYNTSNIERDDRNSKSRTIIRMLQPLIEKIEDYGKALDAYANIAPTYISPIWGSIRVLIVIARAHGKFYDRVVETLGRIGDILPRFRDYERIFDREKHARLTQSISNAYLDIIQLCLDFRTLLQDQQKSSLNRIWKPISLNSHFEEAVQRFREHKKAVEKEAEVCHLIEAAEARSLAEANRKLEEVERKAKLRARLLAQLSNFDYLSKHRSLRKLRYRDTGIWVLSSPEYEGWLKKECPAFLSVYGIPGCGKSVLISTMYDALVQASSNLTTAAYYYDYADKRTLDPIWMFGAIAHQLLQKIEISSGVQSLIEKSYCDGMRVPQLQEVVEIVMTIVEESSGSVTLFVDGLDEVKEHDRQLIFHNLNNMLSTRMPVKLLVSSRNDESQNTDLSDAARYRILLHPEKIATDINAYVHHAVQTLQASQRLAVRHPAVVKEIENALMEGAKGMFLWVKFQLEDLCTAETDAEIRTMLQNLPADLGETYDRLLGRLIGRQRERLIRRMFEWILCSKRPLHIDEMQEAIAFTIDDISWDASKIPTDMRRLVRACGNLVVVDEEMSNVHFAHHTVEQYLLSRPVLLGSSFPFSLQQADVTAAETCLAYLSFTDFEAQITIRMDTASANMTAVESLVTRHSLLPDQKLANTALRVWNSVHAHRKTSTASIRYGLYVPSLKPPTTRLLEKYSMLSYVVDFWLFHTSALDPQLEVTCRTYLLFLNLLRHKRLLFDIFPWRMSQPRLDEDFSAIAKLGWALERDHALLLRAAAETDYAHLLNEAASLGFISELDDETPDIQIDGPTSRLSAILWLRRAFLNAARTGLYRVFCLLRPTLSSKTISHALFHAAAWGRTELVRILLSKAHGPLVIEDVCGYHDNMRVNTLGIAAFRGHTDVVKLLVEEDITFGLPSAGIQLLIEAINKNNTSLIEAFTMALFSGRIIIPNNPDFESNLQAQLELSSFEGNIAVARFLFEKKNYIRSNAWGSALGNAIEGGHYDIVELFFREGCCCLMPESEMRSAFKKIAKFPHVLFAQLFLSHIDEKYDIGNRSKLVQSPLYAAAKFKNSQVVKLLVNYSLDNYSRLENSVYDRGNAGRSDCNEPAMVQAVACDDLTAVDELIEAEAFNLWPPDPKELLIVALKWKHRAVAKRLVEEIAGMQPGVSWGFADSLESPSSIPLIGLAADCGNFPAVEVLLGAQALSIEYEPKDRCLALEAAIDSTNPDVVKAILNHPDMILNTGSDLAVKALEILREPASALRHMPLQHVERKGRMRPEDIMDPLYLFPC